MVTPRQSTCAQLYATNVCLISSSAPAAHFSNSRQVMKQIESELSVYSFERKLYTWLSSYSTHKISDFPITIEVCKVDANCTQGLSRCCLEIVPYSDRCESTNASAARWRRIFLAECSHGDGVHDLALYFLLHETRKTLGRQLSTGASQHDRVAWPDEKAPCKSLQDHDETTLSSRCNCCLYQNSWCCRERS